jgi:hypothetical protein
MAVRRAGGSAAAVVALLCVVALAACGSSSNSSTSAPESSPASAQPPGQVGRRDRFITQADAICQDARRRLKPLQARAKQQEARSDRSGLVQTLTQVNAEASGELAKLKGLPAPPNSALAERYFNGIQTQLTLSQQLAQALKRGDNQAVSTISQQITANTAAVRVTARRYGFKVCGSTGES